MKPDPNPPGVPGSSAFLFLSEPIQLNTANNSNNNKQADVLGKILGWRLSKQSSPRKTKQQLPQIFRQTQNNNTRHVSSSNLKKSLSSDQLKHYPTPLDIPPHSRRLSLPAMHAVLHPHPHHSMSKIHSEPHSSTHHPIMHGVASNESIRTARPDIQDNPPILSPIHPQSIHSPVPPSPKEVPRFQNPRVFDLFTHNPSPERPQNFQHFLSPDLLTSVSPSETSSIPSQPRSLGFSINSSLSSSHLPHNNLPFNMDPRFAIWTDHPSTPQRQLPPEPTPYHYRHRASMALETSHHPTHHAASASTSNLGIDHSTGHLTHLVPHHHHTSVSISPNHPKRWSRTGKNPHHLTPPDPHSKSSPISLSNYPPSLHAAHHLGPSQENVSQIYPSQLSSKDHLLKQSNHHRVLMAATIECWIAQLTTQIDSLGLTEFFFTYRTVMKPNELAQLLASRFEWSIMFSSPAYAKSISTRHPNNSASDSNSERSILSLDGRCLELDHQGEALRRVAKVRTFVMIRHWLVHHFEDDFLHEPSLQTELHDWFENLTEKIKRVQRLVALLDSNPLNSNQEHNQASFSGEDDLRILKTLRRTLRKQQLTHQQSFNMATPSPRDSTQQPITPMEDGKPSRSKHKSPKADARELFRHSKGGAASEPESPFRQYRRPHTANLINRFPSKGSLGHVRHHSANTLAQLHAANFSKSDLRLCEFENGVPDDCENNSDRGNDKMFASKPDQALILKLKSVFKSDTRCPRVQNIMRENNPSSRYSLNQDSKQLLKHNPTSFATHRHRASESASVVSKQLVTPQHRLNLSNPPPPQYQQGSLSLPQYHNPLQRYFTSTMGTIGRFKRMINNRSGPHISSIPVANHHHSFSSGPASSSFLSNDAGCQHDPFNNEIGDLLCVKGGLERYLSFFDIQRDSSISAYVEGPREDDEEALQSENNDGTLRNTGRRGVHQQSLEELNQSVGSPVVQYNHGFQSQLSLSSSLSNTTCTTRSTPSDTDGELEAKDHLVVFDSNLFGEPNQLTQSVPTPQEHLLHGSMSVETIKSESHPLSIPTGGMGLLKKQLRKKFNNKDMCPVLMRASMDESFSGVMPAPTSPVIRYSEDTPCVSHLSPNVSSPNHVSNGELRPVSVQLDDVDTFDSDDESPMGGQKLRRFPGTTDLKQAIAIGRKSIFNLKSGFLKANDDRIKRFSSETSSSIGTRRVPSIAASMFRRSKLSHRSSNPIDRSSVLSLNQPSCVPEVEEEGNGAPAVVANFVADGLESDDDEPGDVEAALRRLEGVIDADREKEKAKKVELQMMKSMEASKRRTRAFSQATSQHSYNSLTNDMDDQLQEHSDHSDDDDDDDGHSGEEEYAEEEEEEGDQQSSGDEERNSQDGDVEGEDYAANEQEDGYTMIHHEPETTLSPFGLGDTRHSKMASPDSRGSASVFPSRPKVTATAPLTPSSKSLSTPGSKSHMRFFANTHTNDSIVLGTNKKSSINKSSFLNPRDTPNQHLMRPTPSGHGSLNGHLNLSTPTPMTRKHVNLAPLPPLPPVHRSFLLDCRTEILAQQFCLIERDLLRNITWQELLLSKWQESRSGHGAMGNHYHHGKKKNRSRGVVAEEGVVTCWETFMKQRAKEKMKLKGRIQNQHTQSNLHNSSSLESEQLSLGGRTKIGGTEIHALIMRFNLTCNWVASELVLTFNLEERVALLGKFIRLAFKCYRQNNFQTLTQIIHGLQTPYIERLKKTWSKLGIWESRMFRDLKEFTSHLSNFKSLRNVQDSLINESSSNLSQASVMNDQMGSNYNPRSSHSHSRGSSSSVTACIPFLGLYLRDLTINDELPTYLDPTDPSVPVELDSNTGRLKKLSNPKILESLPKLPQISNSDLNGQVENYYPLVNINKLRNYAKIVLKIIEFQNRSSRNFNFETHSKWFITCLKINCLQDDQLKSLSLTCEP